MDDKKMSDETSQSVSRRGFIKGVIAAGAVASSSAYLFRTTPLLGPAVGARRGRAPHHAERERPGAPRRRDEAGNAGDDAPLQAGAHGHQARVRPRRVRRLHRPHRRCAALLVLGAHAHDARQEDRRRSKGLADPATGKLSAVQQGVIDEQGFQCAFCMPGFVMAATGYLKTNPNPTRAGAGARRLRQSVPVPGLRQDSHRADARR